MNQPSITVRIAGTPLVGVPLILGGLWLMFMWTQGRASLFLALLGCFVALKTISSLKRVRRYKAWLKEWDAAGTPGTAPARRSTGGWRWATVLASLLFAGIIVCYPNAAGNPELQNALLWLWLFCGIFLIARFVRGIWKFIRKRRSRNEEKADREVEPVSWMIGRTVDSPSRQAAVKSLPGYAARILNR